jgi:hypothetical protein
MAIGASSLVTTVLCALCYLGPGTPAARGWTAAPLFTYAALLGFLLPAVIELGRITGRLPLLPDDVSWPQVHVGLTAFAVVNTIGVFVTGEDSTVGLVISGLGAAGILVGARLLPEELPARRG